MWKTKKVLYMQDPPVLDSYLLFHLYLAISSPILPYKGFRPLVAMGGEAEVVGFDPRKGKGNFNFLN